MPPNPPPARGLRRPWESVPERVRGAFEAWWERRVVQAISLESGFSPGVAARVRAADGSGVFVKAIGPDPNPESPSLHRSEIAVASRLPLETPAPRLLWWLDEGESDGGWVLLAFEELPGDPPPTPWREDTLHRVVDALEALGTALTPNPLPPGTAPRIREAFETWLGGWRMLRDEGGSGGPLDPWSARHVDALAELEAEAARAADGDTLLHCDLRADNMVLGDGRVDFVDWPHARVGAAWIDAVFLAPSVAMQGGPSPEALLARLPSYRAAEPDAVSAVVAALAGYLTHRALQPPPPGLPTVRAFQAAQGVEARRWLAERLGWDPT